MRARKREGEERIFSSPVRMHANIGEEMESGEGVEEEKKKRKKEEGKERLSASPIHAHVREERRKMYASLITC